MTGESNLAETSVASEAEEVGLTDIQRELAEISRYTKGELFTVEWTEGKREKRREGGEREGGEREGEEREGEGRGKIEA